MERWLAYFANQLSDQEREELAMSEAAIKEAMQAAQKFMNDTAERRSYINRQMAIMDYNSGIRSAREEGEKRGEKRGKCLVLRDLVTDGILPLSAAAQRAGMTEEAFRRETGL
ncbi:hypothetical protein [Selenomonas sp.]|uniref:hypothetical protein n=1 Tax=Selenomonas sp. TaxID=2053611 RepID=UPI003A10257A